MTQLTRRAALVVCAVLLAFPAFAHEIVAGTLVIHHPWSRATPTGAKTAAVYMMLHNKGDKPDRLIGAETDAADSAEFHLMSMDNGIMTMRHVDALDIPAAGSAEMAPHGLHIMLTGLKKPLAEYDTFDMTLIFEHAGRVKIEVEVEEMGASEPLE
jgi:copper(I)-binding protein